MERGNQQTTTVMPTTGVTDVEELGREGPLDESTLTEAEREALQDPLRDAPEDGFDAAGNPLVNPRMEDGRIVSDAAEEPILDPLRSYNPDGTPYYGPEGPDGPGLDES